MLLIICLNFISFIPRLKMSHAIQSCHSVSNIGNIGWHCIFCVPVESVKGNVNTIRVRRYKWLAATMPLCDHQWPHEYCQHH